MTLIFDWLGNEGIILLSWWALVTLAGAAVMPLCARLLVGLPDKGYTLSRAVGLLLVGFVFWTLAVLGFVRNTPGSIILAWVIVLIGGWIAYYTLPGERLNWREWWQDHRQAIIGGELLFAVMLVSWALLRAAYPALVATEKPMELAFMSAVQRSETFPPNDPWMSGYAISYYHFGYVMTAALASLSGIQSPVAFNMMIALLFALTGLNSYGVVYNLVRAHSTETRRFVAIAVGGLAMIFVTLFGNFQLPLIEFGYQSGTVSQGYLSFWDAQDRYTAPPEGIYSDEDYTNIAGVRVLDPARWNFWWWFRASRVINDRHLPTVDNGEIVERPVGANVIDEFPQFSFLLADVHPHVLALPFAVLMIGLALNLVLTGTAPRLYNIIFYGVAAGGMMFLNIWDGPIYMVVLVGAEGLRRLTRNQGKMLSGEDWTMTGLFFAALVGLAFFLYLPFFISFRSQASGIVPNVEFPTLFRQYFLMFGPFILLLTPYLLFETWRGRADMNWRLGINVALVILGTLLGLLAFFVLVGSLIPAYRDTVLNYIQARGGLANTIPVILIRRLTHSVTTVILLTALALIVARLFSRATNNDKSTPNDNDNIYTPATSFALLLVACAAGLTLVPEFVYLRDNFGVRINTIFKFYYQAWVMFAIASAFAVYAIIASNRIVTPLRILYSAGFVVVMVMGLMYPVLGIHNRAMIESGRASTAEDRPLTLDGGPSLVSQDDYQAIMCLNDLIKGDDVVVAEAVGPAYRNQYGRVGVLTGIPIVLGWEGHQRQWRGPTYPEVAGTRRTDIELMYNDLRWDIAAQVIDRYNIDYIFYGTTERTGIPEQPGYNPAGEDKFRENLDVVCQFGDSLFYRVTPRALEIVGVNP